MGGTVEYFYFVVGFYLNGFYSFWVLFATVLAGVFGHGQEAFITLALQVLQCELLLSRFSYYREPVWLA